MAWGTLSEPAELPLLAEPRDDPQRLPFDDPDVMVGAVDHVEKALQIANPGSTVSISVASALSSQLTADS